MFVLAFLPGSKCLLISWLQSPSTAILEPNKIKSVTVSIVSSFICNEVMGLDAMILVFWMLSFNPAVSHSSFTFIKRLLALLSFLPLEQCHLHIWGCWWVWPHLNYSFEMYNYLWPVSFLFSILNSLQGTPTGAAVVSDVLMISNIPCLWKWEMSGKRLYPQIKHTCFYYGFLTFNSL